MKTIHDVKNLSTKELVTQAIKQNGIMEYIHGCGEISTNEFKNYVKYLNDELEQRMKDWED
jgi:hypothetical protein